MADLTAQEARRLASEHRAQIGSGDSASDFTNEIAALHYEEKAKSLELEAARNAPVTITITRQQADGVIDALRTLAESERENSLIASRAARAAPIGAFDHRDRQDENANIHRGNETRLKELESIIRKASGRSPAESVDGAIIARVWWKTGDG